MAVKAVAVVAPPFAAPPPCRPLHLAALLRDGGQLAASVLGAPCSW
ncbi:hypothetical protein [Micromonospora sp. C28ISP2-4]|nr:hypothetical protein [Micromonospora sp. C28ISP2-4]MDO3686907.1 hypothetical protein [Micromonospora sp. C28ISP2-4]